LVIIWRSTARQWTTSYGGAWNRVDPAKDRVARGDQIGLGGRRRNQCPSRSAVSDWCSVPSAGEAGATCLRGGSEGGRSPPPSILEERTMDELKGLKVAILVEDGFEQVELTTPQKALDLAGAKTQIVSPKRESVQGWNHHDPGEEFPVDVTLARARPQDFDAL